MEQTFLAAKHTLVDCTDVTSTEMPQSSVAQAMCDPAPDGQIELGKPGLQGTKSAFK